MLIYDDNKLVKNMLKNVFVFFSQQQLPRIICDEVMWLRRIHQ